MILKSIEVDLPEGVGERIDSYLAYKEGLSSRNQVTRRAVSVLLNNTPVKLSKKVKQGEKLLVSWREEIPFSLQGEPMTLSILYEDERVVVIDKPSGMVVHPANGNRTGTLVQGLLHHYRPLGEHFREEKVRPGIVHRLDKETSGVLVVAKDPASLASLSYQFSERSVVKHYLAILSRTPREKRGCIETFIRRDPLNRKRFSVVSSGGKMATTEYEILRKVGDYSLVLLSPRTGRTHQIRVHMRHIGAPILGDALYGKGGGKRLMLHAWRLGIALPGKKGRHTFKAPIPKRMREVFAETRNRKKMKG